MMFLKTAAAATAFLASTTSASYALYINNTISNITFVYPQTVSYANGSMFLGGVNENIYSEPIITASKGGLAFTSYHQVPTGGIEPYIYLNDYRPIQYTSPHSGYYVPPEANFTEFSFGADGYLTYGGQNKFVACSDSFTASLVGYQIFWAGNTFEGPGEPYNCTGPIYLYQAEY